MPKTKISEYSATANSNTDVASINIDEGCAPSGINNAIRAVMGHLKDFQSGTNGDPFNGPVNGTLGATTPSTVAATSITASTTLGVTGVSTLTGGAVIQGLTVGKGAGAVSTNTAVGASALAANTSSGFSTAVGYQAGYTNITGARVTALGYQAGFTNNASDNLYIGSFAGYTNSSGIENTFIGPTAGYYVTGSYNTAVGALALSYSTSGATGSYNTAIGNSALKANTTADGNTAVGYQAGYTNTTGTYNTYCGWHAGYVATGTGNSYLGTSAGYAMTTGSKNTILGAYGGNQGGLDIRTASNYIVLSDGDGNPRGYFGGPGSIGDGCFIKTGNSSTSRILPATDNVGYIGEGSYRWQAIYAVNGTIQTSDGREKNTIEDSNLGLDFVTSLRPVSYKWNVGENVVTYDEENSPIVTPRAGVRSHYGFIAQEVKAVIPEGVDFGGFVQEPDDGRMSLRYHEFIGPLVKAIQELKAEVDSLKAQINGASA